MIVMLIILLLVRCVQTMIVCGSHPQDRQNSNYVHQLAPGDRKSFYCAAANKIVVSGSLYVQDVHVNETTNNIVIDYEAPRLGNVLYSYDMIVCDSNKQQYIIYIRFVYEPLVLSDAHTIFLPNPGLVVIEYPFLAAMYPCKYQYRYLVNSSPAIDWRPFNVSYQNPIARIESSQVIVHQLRENNSVILESSTRYSVEKKSSPLKEWDVAGLDYGEFIQLCFILLFYFCIFVINELISCIKNKI